MTPPITALHLRAAIFAAGLLATVLIAAISFLLVTRSR
jgi:hypothetical protein